MKDQKFMTPEINPDSIKKSIDLARDFINKESNNNLVEDYQYRETSKIIVNNIFSLTAKINKYTWRK